MPGFIERTLTAIQRHVGRRDVQTVQPEHILIQTATENDRFIAIDTLESRDDIASLQLLLAQLGVVYNPSMTLLSGFVDEHGWSNGQRHYYPYMHKIGDEKNIFIRFFIAGEQYTLCMPTKT